MVDNTTGSNTSLLADNGSNVLECSNPLELFTTVVNVIALVINCLHLWIISRLRTLKGTPYRCVLINLALADIVHNVYMATFYSCYKFFIINFSRGEPELRIPITMAMFIRNYISFHVFALASMEKYLAICKPFSYKSSVIVRRLSVNFFIVWLYVVSPSTGFAIVEALDLIPWMTNVRMTVLRTSVLAIAPSLLSGTLLIKVYQELRRMRIRSQNSSKDSDKTKAAMHLIIIFTLEVIVFLLNSICVIVMHSTGVVVICKIWNAFIKAPYTILNAVIYGWRTRSYRQYVRELISCNQRRVGIAEG